MAKKIIKLSPQPGPQEKFLNSTADIAIYGGAAGGGKSYALLLEPLRNLNNPRFGAVFFRRNLTQLAKEGGALDEARAMYSFLGADVVGHPKTKFTFKGNSTVTFDHLQHEDTVHDWQGAQVPLIIFDELTQFTEKQFWYMLSRNRSTCGVKPYIRAATNPDPDSFVRDLIEWWLDDKGFPIQERSGVIRWFIRLNNRLIWADSPDDLAKHKDPNGNSIQPKSLTFIPAKLEDNQKLMKADPGYMANLLALHEIDREQLLAGNWNIRPVAGMFFDRVHFNTVQSLFGEGIKRVRAWDRAATPENSASNKDPDFTSGVLLAMNNQGTVFIEDVVHCLKGGEEVETLIKQTAHSDGVETEIALYQDPGSAGKYEVQAMVKKLEGFTVHTYPASSLGGKIAMAKPFSSQCRAGNVMLLPGNWHKAFFNEGEQFPEGKHDDIIDAASLAYRRITDNSFYVARRGK